MLPVLVYRELTLVNVVPHDRDSVVNLGVNSCGLGVGEVGSTARGIGAGIPRRDVRVVAAIVLCRHVGYE